MTDTPIATRLRELADRYSEALADLDWRPRRDHVEGARNLLREADREIHGLTAALATAEERAAEALKDRDVSIETANANHVQWERVSAENREYLIEISKLDAVVHVLGIEDSEEQDPAEAVTALEARCAELEKAHLPNLSIKAGNDGTWLCFKASTGKSAMIHLEGLGEGFITGTAIKNWCADFRALGGTANG